MGPLFLAEGWIFVETGRTGSNLGTGPELAVELPRWKRGNIEADDKINVSAEVGCLIAATAKTLQSCCLSVIRYPLFVYALFIRLNN